MSLTKEELMKAIRAKKSNAVTAAHLGLTVDEYLTLKREITSAEIETAVEMSSAENILKDHNLTHSFNVSSGWIKEDGISVQFKRKEENTNYKEHFVEFLKTFIPKKETIESHIAFDNKTEACLVVNIQDFHTNKYDIYGDNNIHKRLTIVEKKLQKVLINSVCVNNLAKIVYIVGSDIFNSEFTDMTTKGTPQQNISSYQEAFKTVSQHQIDIIEMLLSYSREVEIIYCPGNHDEFVGWHLVNWLQSYFRNQNNLKFDSSPNYTKFIRFSDTAMCINHGDAQKPETLARNFPILYKENWSKCNNFVIFCGDKHTELSRDLNGIEFYRIAALSTATSKWDEKNGYTTSKPKLTAFLIEENAGVTGIIKQPLI